MKIILATDGTKHSEMAAGMLGKLALQAGDVVKIISVIDMAMPLAIDMYAGYLPNTAELEKIARENAETTLEETSKLARRIINDEAVLIESETLVGSPESRIVECAEEFGAELIIVGSHGYNRWERLLLGSVSDSVIHHAPCSVLVVRTPAE
jgi:nucleotide-binding universal stress UspA family protein